MPLDPDQIYSERETAQMTNLSVRTLARQRENGSGIPFIQLSAHRIGYRGSAINEWLVVRTYQQRVAEPSLSAVDSQIPLVSEPTEKSAPE